jgi:frataxin
LTLDRYLRETHRIFEHIFEKIDSLDLDLIDNIDLTEGVLNIRFKSNQSYVLNIQRPNLQIWLSSPISGPQRFEYDQDKDIWFNIRNSKNLLNILNEEFNKIIKDNNGKEIYL